MKSLERGAWHCGIPMDCGSVDVEADTAVMYCRIRSCGYEETVTMGPCPHDERVDVTAFDSELDQRMCVDCGGVQERPRVEEGITVAQAAQNAQAALKILAPWLLPPEETR